MRCESGVVMSISNHVSLMRSCNQPSQHIARLDQYEHIGNE